MSEYAQVAVENAVYHFDRPFTYRIPRQLLGETVPGVRVMVPFGAGNRARVAVVLALSGDEVPGAKDILSVLDKEPVIPRQQLKLVLWMKERYFCTLFEAAKLMIPSGMNLKLKNSYVLAEGFKDFDRESYTDVQWQVIMLLHASVKAVPFEKIAEETGIAETHPAFETLYKKGVLCKVNVASAKIRDAVARMVRPVSDFSGKLTKRQAEVLAVLQEAGTATEKELSYFTGASPGIIRALCEKGAVQAYEYEVYRRPEVGQAMPCEKSVLCLSPEQEKAYTGLLAETEKKAGSCALLYGVTGSGKTSVFMKLIESVRQKGKTVIVMVPEISLTAQTITAFTAMFGEDVAVFHSGLSLGERLDEWKRVNRREAKIVVGTRSAVFAPVQDLGLIVIDEEQEHTYKSESSPRYDAREVARWRCAQSSALCLFSSATPSIESAFQAQKRRISFYKLENRYGTARLPQVELADLNEDSSFEGEVLIGHSLQAALQENFELGQQSIVLLNRRGYHTFASCRACGEVMACPNCSISLTYHSANNRLMCHYCGYSVPFTKKCPSCKSEAVTFRGVGTQRVEEELCRLLPQARVLRMDTDAVTAKCSLEKSLGDFAKGEYDVMIGTQMVAKGLDFENVTLVGVVSADQMLFSDDFRSNERAFDLLTQVVGRAGRGKKAGKALIQTYVPENPYLSLAARQDYFGFYRREIEYRKAMLYPPFADILVIGFVGVQERKVKAASEYFTHSLTELAKNEYGEIPLRVLQAAPANISKISNKYRYRIILKCKNTKRLREMIASLLVQYPKNRTFQDVTVYADSNPYTII